MLLQFYIALKIIECEIQLITLLYCKKKECIVSFHAKGKGAFFDT